MVETRLTWRGGRVSARGACVAVRIGLVSVRQRFLWGVGRVAASVGWRRVVARGVARSRWWSLVLLVNNAGWTVLLEVRSLWSLLVGVMLLEKIGTSISTDASVKKKNVKSN